LRSIPDSQVREISSSSANAWSYGDDDFAHRVIYLQEKNEDTGNVHPLRLLISEGRIMRQVTVRAGAGFKTEKYETKGPVACISTTTEHSLAIDDETRHVSIWIDESEKQTRRIIKAEAEGQSERSQEDIGLWRNVQRVIAARAATPIEMPRWFSSDSFLRHVRADDIRVRRYFPAFTQACKTVCLIRSFSRDPAADEGQLVVDFIDFAITATIFDRVFADSIRRPNDEHVATRQFVKAMVAENGGAVQAADYAVAARISLDDAYARLRDAARSGAVRRVNKPGKNNLKLFLPSECARFIPSPQKIFSELTGMPNRVEYIDPLTGELVVLSR